MPAMPWRIARYYPPAELGVEGSDDAQGFNAGPTGTACMMVNLVTVASRQPVDVLRNDPCLNAVA
jgi:hypothetical protein